MMNKSLRQLKALSGVSLTLGLFMVCVILIGKENQWFDPKVHFKTSLSEAHGLREGTVVTLSGIKVGEVESIVVDEDNRILLQFSVSKGLAHKVRSDSVARVVRSLLVGEKRIDLSPGGKGQEILLPGALVKGVDSFELTDLFSGARFGQVMEGMQGLGSTAQNLGEALKSLSEQVRPQDLAKIYKELIPTLHNLNKLTVDLQEVVGQVKKEAPRLAPMIRQGQELIAHTDKILTPLAKDENRLAMSLMHFDIVASYLAKHPEFPPKMVEALQEGVTTLKAMQKSYFLRDHVPEKNGDSQ